MTTPRGDVDAAVAGLQARWGAAAPRVVGALALAPEPARRRDAAEPIAPLAAIAPLPGERVIHTGFAALDAILGPGGLPDLGQRRDPRRRLERPHHPRPAASPPRPRREGSVVAWLDLSRSFDPVEAVARGVRLEWLVVITPATLDEGLSHRGQRCSPAARSTCSSSTCPAAAWPGPTRRRRSPTGSIGSPRSPGARRRCS